MPLAEPLSERDDALRLLAAQGERARAGAGRLVLLRGATGTGRTALLGAAAEQAAGRGMRVLRGRGTPDDGGADWGVARQLFGADADFLREAPASAGTSPAEHPADAGRAAVAAAGDVRAARPAVRRGRRRARGRRGVAPLAHGGGQAGRRAARAARGDRAQPVRHRSGRPRTRPRAVPRPRAHPHPRPAERGRRRGPGAGSLPGRRARPGGGLCARRGGQPAAAAGPAARPVVLDGVRRGRHLGRPARDVRRAVPGGVPGRRLVVAGRRGRVHGAGRPLSGRPGERGGGPGGRRPHPGARG
ncbi:ATP-binding protein [Streptomyces althioticus]